MYRPRRLVPFSRSYRGGMSLTTSCTDCGTNPSPERPSLLWSMAVRDGRRSFTCGPCARTHLNVIESGVDIARW
jgi:hypothetical protein